MAASVWFRQAQFVKMLQVCRASLPSATGQAGLSSKPTKPTTSSTKDAGATKAKGSPATALGGGGNKAAPKAAPKATPKAAAAGPPPPASAASANMSALQASPPEPPEPLDNSSYRNTEHWAYTPHTYADVDVDLAALRQPQPSSRG